MADREEDRWSKIDSEHTNDEEKWRYLREESDKAKRNVSSVPYDPITLKYNDNQDGLRLRYADDTIRYRAALRAQNLQSRMTADGFNPVTGNALPPPVLPERPVPSWEQGQGETGGQGPIQ